jgi:hypothetical protein
MARTVRLPKETPLLDIVSYGRGGPHAGRGFSPAQVEQIRLTVNRVPEVMVKVLPSGSSDLKSVGRHLDYIGRQGGLAIETDEGERLHQQAAKALLEDWDLDIDALRPQSSLIATKGRKPPKLVHKLMFSMPPGTPPQKVLTAVRNLAREEFYGQHRYVLVLHTDEPHPHVHLVLKAINEQGVRLNIKKATLRHWRSQFAQHLRQLGVAANATERAVRGQVKTTRKDGIYRASKRGASTYMRAQAESVAKELLKGDIRVEPGKRTLLQTRAAVQQGWWAVAEQLARSGQRELAADTARFIGGMARPQTDREWIAQQLLAAAARLREARVPSI